ncbi:MAG TPA: branched-chain amino acid ABC transporter substrate-binding protein [Acidimicrobiales bacterium]|nr:branched-chain amino acid ABC transporter substrate-binding protein [Acidimicrobiales bacterium]
MLFAAALVLAACGSDKKNDEATGGSSNTGKKAVTLAFVGPLTGPNANLGINIRDGMQVAVQEANEKSKKYTYTIKDFDTQGDPAQAPGQAAKYIPDTSIVGIVGPTYSGETRAVLKDLQANQLVMISPSATNVTLNSDPATDVFHRVIPDDGVQSQGIADYVTKKLKPKSVALIHDNSDYGKGLWEGVVKLLDQAGIKVAVTDAVDPKGQNYSVAVNKVKDAKVDLVFYGGYYNEAGRLKKQLTDAGVTATFLSGDGSLDPGFVVSSGTAGGEGALISCPCRLATAELGGDLGAFATKYKEVVNKTPGTYSSEAYDASNILIQGIEAGNDTRPKLLAYVEGLDSYNGISKTIQFNPDGNVKAGDVFVYQVKGGKIVELGKASELAG